MLGDASRRHRVMPWQYFTDYALQNTSASALQKLSWLLACSCAPYSSTETNHTYAGKNQFEKMVVLQPWTKYCEIPHYGKILISIFRQFLASIDKVFILGGRLGTRIKFYEDFRFPWSFLISWDPKSEVVWQLVRQPLYTIFSTNNHALFHLR